MKKLNSLILVLFISTVMLFSAWVSLHFSAALDLREQESVILSEVQKQKLKNIPKKVEVTVYNHANPKIIKANRKLERELKKFIPNLELRFVNISTAAEEIKAREINNVGELYVDIDGKGKKLKFASLEGVIRTVFELLDTESIIAVHIQGNQERSITADTIGSWREMYKRISNKTLQISAIDLKKSINIPENAAFAVFADPDPIGNNASHIDAALRTFINAGGNVIWTTDSDKRFLPQVLSEIAGAEILDGVVIDMQSQTLGFSDPRLIPAELSNNSPITQNINQLPLLPGAVAFALNNPPKEQWQRHEILRSSAQSWNETAFSTGTIALDGEEKRGPLILGIELVRKTAGKEQKIIILGDSDLFSGDAFSAGGNFELARNIFASFAPEASLETIQNRPLPDQFIKWSKNWEFAAAVLIIIVLPFGILALGLLLRRSFRSKYKYRLQ